MDIQWLILFLIIGIMIVGMLVMTYSIGETELVFSFFLFLLIPVFGVPLYLYFQPKFKNKQGGNDIPRHNWTVIEKEQVRERQDGKCNRCKKSPERWEYHHRDGNRSNNSLSNCEALCPTCHSVKTHG